jgi:hypothetical protein
MFPPSDWGSALCQESRAVTGGLRLQECVHVLWCARAALALTRAYTGQTHIRDAFTYCSCYCLLQTASHLHYRRRPT